MKVGCGKFPLSAFGKVLCASLEQLSFETRPPARLQS
jgi:hypothetical protein